MLNGFILAVGVLTWFFSRIKFRATGVCFKPSSGLSMLRILRLPTFRYQSGFCAFFGSELEFAAKEGL